MVDKMNNQQSEIDNQEKINVNSSELEESKRKFTSKIQTKNKTSNRDEIPSKRKKPNRIKNSPEMLEKKKDLIQGIQKDER
jgi:hypothetical protein